MKTCSSSLVVALGWCLAAGPIHARIVTVTTADNLNPAAGEMSLLQALSQLQDGDEIRFHLPGDGPHFIETPPEGYPLIRRHQVVIDGYTQPGAAPNTGSILAANNARLAIVLDSRNGHARLMDFPPTQPHDVTGYGPEVAAVLGVVGGQGFTLRGVSLLAVPFTGPGQGVEVHGVALAQGATGRVSGCWIGVAPDGETWAGPNKGISGLRYQQRDEHGQVTGELLINGAVIGVPRASASPAADFNVFAGISAVPLLLEGNGSRISGNFLGVLPDGLRDVNLSLDPQYSGSFGGHVRIGRGGNDTVIGTDGDGANDAEERNVIGGALPALYGGAQHSLAFYDVSPGTNIVIAGNYVGVGVDGQTTFTNGVAVLSAPGGQAVYRFGSDFDGVSDAAEGNVVHNHWPESLFNPGYFDFLYPNDLNFLDGLAAGSLISLRGNTLVNNLPFPVSPTRLEAGLPGGWLAAYYRDVLAEPEAGVQPVIDPASTARRLLGTVPLAKLADFPGTMVDVYVADPVGIATGQAVQFPELPQGFVQGRQYLASWRDNGPEDADPVRGRFDFDLTPLGLTEALLTVTANYLSGGPAPEGKVAVTSPFSDPVRVTGGPVEELRFTAVMRVAGGVRLEWTGGGTLQAAPAPTQGWSDVAGASSPLVVPANEAHRFFRLRR